MVGSGRKRKREEKSKTQLKKPKTAPGKHLPKGTNETKTKFKVAKIVVPGQRPECSSVQPAGPVTNKKLNLKDVLAKISHFSLAVRMDGLEGLKELVTGPSAAALAGAQLAPMLGAVMPATGDRERKVRRLATACLAALLPHAPAAALAPLHPLLAAHLGCALTHIDPRIQQDGLATLDCLLTGAHGFVRSSLHQILPNCLDQISAKRKPGAKTAGPHVAANLSESISSLQWRVSVLARIDAILAVVSPGPAVAPPEERVEVQDWVLGRSFPLVLPAPQARLPLAGLGTLATAGGLRDQALLVLPLLIETWVEARAGEERQAAKSSVLPREVAELLVSLAGILDKLVRLLDEKELEVVRAQFGRELAQHLLPGLPYSCPEMAGPTAGANLQLASLGLALEAEVPAGVLQAVLAGGSTSGGSRVRLAGSLLARREELAPEVRESCVAALVGALEAAGPGEGGEAVRLLREQAAVGQPGPTAAAWVRQLPGDLASRLAGEGDRRAAGRLADCCLALAKTRNADLAASFLARAAEITGSIRPEETALGQKVEWTRQHCERA